MADKLDDKGFLQRWSARKTDARDGDGADVATLDDAHIADDAIEPAEAADSSSQSSPSDLPPDLPPEDLPDVETLDADSDYTVFMGENVPQDVAKMALRKLWRSDPVLANLDGLNDYDEDFSKVGMVTEAVKTAYQVGKGFLTDDDDAEKAPDADSHAEPQTEPQAEPQAEPGENDADGDDDAADASDAASGEDGSDASEFHNAEYIKPS